MKSFLIRSNNYLQFKWYFFKATHCFHTGKLEEAGILFENMSYCYKKKTPLEIYTYVVMLMWIVESGKQNDLLVNYATWQKLLYRNSKSLAKTEPRLSAILKILKTLVAADFNFEKTFRKEKDLLQLLIDGKGKYKFEFGRYEVVRFDVWLMKYKGAAVK